MTFYVGSARIDALIDGEIVIPKEYAYPDVPAEAWEGYEYVTEGFDGMVPATLGAFLVRYADRVVLIDAGVGPNAVAPMLGGALRSSLLSHVTPDEVTDVIFTHLHWDHLGWATVNGKNYFPNATYWADKRDWDHFCAEDFTASWELEYAKLEELPHVKLKAIADKFEFFEGEADLIPGFRTLEASGHTPGSTVLILTSDGVSGAFTGDLTHSVPELIEGWRYLAMDDIPTGLASTKRVRDMLVETGMPFAGSHFPGLPWGTLVKNDQGKIVWERIGEDS